MDITHFRSSFVRAIKNPLNPKEKTEMIVVLHNRKNPWFPTLEQNNEIAKATREANTTGIITLDKNLIKEKSISDFKIISRAIVATKAQPMATRKTP
jgi:hypothetical protein